MFESLRRWLSSKDVEDRRGSPSKGRSKKDGGTTSADRRYQRRLDVVENSLGNVEQRLDALGEYTSTLQEEIAELKASLDRMEASINEEIRASSRESRKVSSLVREISSKRDEINRLQRRFTSPNARTSGMSRANSHSHGQTPSRVTISKKDVTSHPFDDAVEWDELSPPTPLQAKGTSTEKERHVTTSFLLNGGKILVLQRSHRVKTYPGLWAGISGSIQEAERPTQTAIREIMEETGLDKEKLTLLREGSPFLVKDGPRTWHVHPFLFLTETRDIGLDWEHSDSRWVLPNELSSLSTVPDLKKSLERVID